MRVRMTGEGAGGVQAVNLLVRSGEGGKVTGYVVTTLHGTTSRCAKVKGGETYAGTTTQEGGFGDCVKEARG